MSLVGKQYQNIQSRHKRWRTCEPVRSPRRLQRKGERALSLARALEGVESRRGPFGGAARYSAGLIAR